ncbi:hypothetical protein [Streptomyces griseosporeus]|uniref:hypothetical protein n=1 Tax=Streptomyces griseosporeus TaxID=1910 RepID=UPI0036FBDD43
MSWMEFIVGIKWPLLILLLVMAGAWSMRKEERRKAMSEWTQGFLANRDISLTAGPAALALTSAPPQLVDSMAVAAQPITGEVSTELPKPTMSAQGEVAGGQSEVVMRREAVEQVMRSSAEWGWEVAQRGLREPPVMEIRWREDGRPEIHVDYDPASLARSRRHWWPLRPP